MKKEIIKKIKIPENCEVTISDKFISIKKGSEEIKISYGIREFKPKIENGELVLGKKSANKKEKMLIHSIASHVDNAFNGMEKKYEYQLQICSIHFPMNVKVEKNMLIVKNFFGERKDRILSIKPGIEIKVENDIIILKSSNKSLVGEQASQIEALTHIKSRDRRVFQDGIWIIKKQKGRKNEEA